MQYYSQKHIDAVRLEKDASVFKSLSDARMPLSSSGELHSSAMQSVHAAVGRQTDAENQASKNLLIMVNKEA